MSEPPQQPYGQQPQPMGPPPGPPMQQPVPVQARPTKQKRFGWLPLIIASVVALLLGIGIGAAGDGGAGTTAAPQPTVTVTETAEPPAVEGGGEPTTEAPAAFNPKPKDFQVGIKVLRKQCFGEAGCNISYRIAPKYVGKQKLPEEGTVYVTYEVSGPRDPIIGTFTIENGQAHFSKEESAGTSSSSKKLTAKVTEVEYDEFG